MKDVRAAMRSSSGSWLRRAVLCVCGKRLNVCVCVCVCVCVVYVVHEEGIRVYKLWSVHNSDKKKSFKEANWHSPLCCFSCFLLPKRASEQSNATNCQYDCADPSYTRLPEYIAVHCRSQDFPSRVPGGIQHVSIETNGMSSVGDVPEHLWRESGYVLK